MRLYALSGDRASVQRTYQSCLAALERELGAEPSPATRAAYEEALQLEAHGDGYVNFTSPRGSNNLPIQLTSFIGRTREIELVTQLIAKNRLLTLTGAGGSGKTRL